MTRPVRTRRRKALVTLRPLPPLWAGLTRSGEDSTPKGIGDKEETWFTPQEASGEDSTPKGIGDLIWFLVILLFDLFGVR